MYNVGLGVEKDYFKAVGLYNKSCNAGSGSGCNNLGFMYYEGKGVRKDKSKALEYYGKACDLKCENGCENYAILK